MTLRSVVASIVLLATTYPVEAQSIEVLKRGKHFLCYQVRLMDYTNKVIDSVQISWPFQSIDTLLHTKFDQGIVVLYETNSTNRITKGTTVNMERYIVRDGRLVKQSEFIISKRDSELSVINARLDENILTVIDATGYPMYTYRLSDYDDLGALASELVSFPR